MGAGLRENRKCRVTGTPRSSGESGGGGVPIWLEGSGTENWSRRSVGGPGERLTFSALQMTVHNLYLFDRNGVCLHYSEWHRKKQAGIPKEEVTRGPRATRVTSHLQMHSPSPAPLIQTLTHSHPYPVSFTTES